MPPDRRLDEARWSPGSCDGGRWGVSSHGVGPLDEAEGVRTMDVKEFERQALRAMTPEAKLAVLGSMIRQAYELTAAGLRSLHPELPENEVLARARELVGGGRA